jgi:hypothetical protein
MLCAIGNRPGWVFRLTEMRGVGHFLRQFTAMWVKEHLRSQIEEAGRPPYLTANEVELVRSIRDGRFDWDAYLAGRLEAPD